MLYIKNINEITYDDVINFCNQNIRENEILEYKSDFTRNLDKVISSLANTFGGIIIIGIDDDDGLPRQPFEGINYVAGLHERVTQIDISNIYPPVMPELQVCPPVNNKTFVVIRISQSNSAPHYIKHLTKAYVRTGNITPPEKIANVNELEWLRNRRQKAVDFRKLLLKNVEQNFKNIGGLEGMTTIPYSVLTISSCPLFPSKTLVLPNEIEEILIHMNVLPIIKYNRIIRYRHLPIQYGLATVLRNGYVKDYLEINQFGLVSKKRNFVWEQIRPTQEQVEDGESVPGNRISFEEIFLSILSFFEFIDNFYETIGYHGYCNLQISVKNILNISLNPYVNIRILRDGVSITEEYILPEEFEIISIPKFKDLDVRLNCLIGISKNLAWALGSELEPGTNIEEDLKTYAILQTGRQRP